MGHISVKRVDNVNELGRGRLTYEVGARCDLGERPKVGFDFEGGGVDGFDDSVAGEENVEVAATLALALAGLVSLALALAGLVSLALALASLAISLCNAVAEGRGEARISDDADEDELDHENDENAKSSAHK